MTATTLSTSPSKPANASLHAVWRLIDKNMALPKRKQAKQAANAGGDAGFEAGFDPGFEAITQPISNEKAIYIIKQGMPTAVMEPLSGYLGVGRGELAKILDMDRTTALRRSGKDMSLPKRSAENVLRVLDLEALARATFAQEDAALQWLRKPHPLLAGESPLMAAATHYGVQQVKEILVAIKYGGVV